MATKKAKVAAYIENSLRDRAEKLAKARGRSLSNLIERVLLKEVEIAIEQGEIEKEPEKISDRG